MTEKGNEYGKERELDDLLVDPSLVSITNYLMKRETRENSGVIHIHIYIHMYIYIYIYEAVLEITCDLGVQPSSSNEILDS